jgi:hypothetical protein
MKREIRKEIKRILRRDNIVKLDDFRIEEIAMGFPEEYKTEAEFISLQEKIAEMI